MSLFRSTSHTHREATKSPAKPRCASAGAFFVLAGLILSVGATGSLWAQARTSTPPQFEVGLIRADGMLIPIAAYARSRWARAWAEPDFQPPRSTPLSLSPNVWEGRGVAVPTEWHLWPTESGRSIDVKVTGSTRTQTHCLTQPALTTTAPTIGVPANAWPMRKLGLATHGEVSVARVAEATSSDPFWSEATRVVRAAFNAKEAEERRLHHIDAIAENPSPQPRVVRLYYESATSAPTIPSTLYFIAEKTYKAAVTPQDPCPAQVVMTGWLTSTPSGALRLAAGRVYIADCDSREVQMIEPLGAVHVSRDQVYWIGEENGYESERYVIFEAGAAIIRRVFEVEAGGC